MSCTNLYIIRNSSNGRHFQCLCAINQIIGRYAIKIIIKAIKILSNDAVLVAIFIRFTGITARCFVAIDIGIVIPSIVIINRMSNCSNLGIATNSTNSTAIIDAVLGNIDGNISNFANNAFQRYKIPLFRILRTRSNILVIDTVIALNATTLDQLDCSAEVIDTVAVVMQDGNVGHIRDRRALEIQDRCTVVVLLLHGKQGHTANRQGRILTLIANGRNERNSRTGCANRYIRSRVCMIDDHARTRNGHIAVIHDCRRIGSLCRSTCISQSDASAAHNQFKRCALIVIYGRNKGIGVRKRSRSHIQRNFSLIYDQGIGVAVCDLMTVEIDGNTGQILGNTDSFPIGDIFQKINLVSRLGSIDRSLQAGEQKLPFTGHQLGNVTRYIVRICVPSTAHNSAEGISDIYTGRIRC